MRRREEGEEWVRSDLYGPVQAELPGLRRDWPLTMFPPRPDWAAVFFFGAGPLDAARDRQGLPGKFLPANSVARVAAYATMPRKSPTISKVAEARSARQKVALTNLRSHRRNLEGRGWRPEIGAPPPRLASHHDVINGGFGGRRPKFP